ncbi:circularly permuted type 2 ATP-grasp protein [Anoxynatronum buryatiense]|uniref:Uncharacterized conserved protein, circularly permuted ATPgrasp superfamily n=1 Tax=Anoxynatronum buryatiense TaxID=489973 RepID=A0AA46AJE6_9CLOT|nr:circularly permuted type 2 ATP-grasp protein [Anoxynatronum buryatiense]SMP60094.1 Uncharacterized conserved protein, circularly permuted ATPgrasp superfamily [Anoxynatronum buryatiense]
MKETLSPYWDQYRQWVLAHPREMQASHEGLMAAVADSPAKYKGKPVEFLHHPFFMTSSQWQHLDRITQTMMNLIKRVTSEYVENPAFRKHFPFSPLTESLILKDPGYDYPVPVTRIDLFYQLETGAFQFCEINTDGSSGMVEARELQQIIGSSPTVNALNLPADALRGGEFFNSWVDALQRNYRHWRVSRNKGPDFPENPRVAIVDLFSSEPPSEFMEFQKAFEKAGCPCVVADARELVLKDGRLMAGEQVIDVIYRRLVTWELVENWQQLTPLAEAIEADHVCLVGAVRSQIPHHKRFFAILHDEEATGFLDESQRRFIREHVPYTAQLQRNNEADWQHWLKEKDRYIIKPEDRYASYGVYAGRDWSSEEWEKKLQRAAAEDYLIQEFCQVPQLPMAVVEEHRVDFEPFYYLTGCFVYNEIFQGPYIRAGRHSIIGSVVECFTVPAFQVADQ